MTKNTRIAITDYPMRNTYWWYGFFLLTTRFITTHYKQIMFFVINKLLLLLVCNATLRVSFTLLQFASCILMRFVLYADFRKRYPRN